MTFLDKADLEELKYCPDSHRSIDTDVTFRVKRDESYSYSTVRYIRFVVVITNLKSVLITFYGVRFAPLESFAPTHGKQFVLLWMTISSFTPLVIML